MFKRLSYFVLAVILGTVALVPRVASAATTPAIAQFDAAFARVHDFTYKLRAHEVKGSAVQDRVYDYSFMKPHFAKTLIESGDGQGSGGVWAGGDQVSGHQGGILSGLHLKVSLHDGRATSLLGYTIPDGLPQNVVATFVNVPGKLTQSPGGLIDGVKTYRLDLAVANPAKNMDITHQVLYLSQVTHFPLRQILSVGSKVVLDQSFLNLKTNVGLTQNDFPF
ncbi:MAG TPA: hypothetical protein VNF68_10125 [Candidatus Baltobacteraceae bacterium]|nr:hypothetical protein [Candidatus Baltobacteraceae bacterium]